MTISTKKFSEFVDGGDLENNNLTVGLEGGVNASFNNPWTFLADGTTGDRPTPTPSIYYRLRFNITLVSYEFYDPVLGDWVQLEDSGDISDLIARLAAHTVGDGASMIGLQNQSGVTNKTVQDLANATIIAQTDNGTLTNGQFLDDLSNGVVYNTGGVLGADPDFITNGAGTVTITGELNVDNINLNGSTITTNSLNSDLTLDPNGLGIVTLNNPNSFTSRDLGAIQVIGLSSDGMNGAIAVGSFGSLSGGNFNGFRSRGTGPGVFSAVQPGDLMARVQCYADDGVQFTRCGRSEWVAVAAVSPGIVPSEYVVQTMDSTGTLNTGMTINSNATVTFPNNISANNFLAGYTTTVSSLGTTILTVNSTYLQYFTGASVQTLQMPVTSTLVLGQSWRVVNNSSGALTVNSSGGNLIVTMPFNTTAEITCILTSGTTDASWNATLISDAGSSGTVNTGSINQLAWYAANGNTVSGLTGANSAVLVTTSAGVPGFSSSMTNGQLIIGSTAGTPTAATLTAGTGISITNAAGSITLNATGGALTWTTLAGTTQAAAVNNGYVSGAAAQTTITLPATASVGAMVAVEGLGAGGWVLTANTGQTIKIGSQTTSSAGSLTSAVSTDNVYVTCIVANTTWRVRSTNSAGLTYT